MPRSKQKPSATHPARSERQRQEQTPTRAPLPPPATHAVPHGRRALILASIAVIAVALGLITWKRGHDTRLSPPSGATAVPSARDAEEQALRVAVAQRPRDPAAQLALARYLLQAQRPMEALWHLLAVQELSPSDRTAWIGAPHALTRAGLPDQARNDLTRLGPAQAGAPDFCLARAEAFLAMAQPRAAVEALAHAGPALAVSAPALVMLGDARAAAGDPSGAESAYRRAAALAPKEAVAWDHLGRLALMGKVWAVARKAFTTARELEPGNPGHAYRLGLALWGTGERETAEALWQTVATASPSYAPVQLALGRRLRDRKDWNAAAAHLTAAAQADAASEEAQLLLAEVRGVMGERASALYQRGFAFLASDQPDRALAEFHRMIAIAPDRADGSLMASFAEVQRQRLDRAAAEAERGLERHPDDARLLGRLALLRVLLYNRAKAQELCEAWLKRDPNAVEALHILARIAREEQRLPDALRLGEQALAKDPGNGAVCFELSRTLAEMPGRENTRRALDLARGATERSPGEAEYWHQLGVLLHTTTAPPEEAAGALLRALEHDVGSVASGTLLVQIAAQERRPRTARYFTSLLTALEARHRSDKALWRAVFSHPGDAAAHARLAHFLLADGDLRRARNQLRQLVVLRSADAAARGELAVVERLLELKAE